MHTRIVLLKEHEIDLSKFEIVNEEEKPEACATAIKLVREGKASLPMKGFVDTSVALKALLNKEYGLRTGNLICHVGMMEVPGFDRMFLLSDSAMACVEIAHAMGNENPKVAVLCAVEKVNPKMPATLDAAELTRMNEEGEITGCMVKGPLAMVNAVSVEAEHQKVIEHQVAGNADILITTDIEAGNILKKSIDYFS